MNEITFQTHVESASVHIEHLEAFIGKDIKIVVSEIEKITPTTKKKAWKFIGAENSHGELNLILNLRDFAHDE